MPSSSKPLNENQINSNNNGSNNNATNNENNNNHDNNSPIHLNTTLSKQSIKYMSPMETIEEKTEAKTQLLVNDEKFKIIDHININGIDKKKLQSKNMDSPSETNSIDALFGNYIPSNNDSNLAKIIPLIQNRDKQYSIHTATSDQIAAAAYLRQPIAKKETGDKRKNSKLDFKRKSSQFVRMFLSNHNNKEDRIVSDNNNNDDNDDNDDTNDNNDDINDNNDDINDNDNNENNNDNNDNDNIDNSNFNDEEYDDDEDDEDDDDYDLNYNDDKPNDQDSEQNSNIKDFFLVLFLFRNFIVHYFKRNFTYILFFLFAFVHRIPFRSFSNIFN